MKKMHREVRALWAQGPTIADRKWKTSTHIWSPNLVMWISLVTTTHLALVEFDAFLFGVDSRETRNKESKDQECT